MNNFKVSIVTISYNAAELISGTIESILNSKYKNLEYILVDGNSTDNTNKIISMYIPLLIQKNIEVRYISEPDKGISDAFNKGIGMATGEIIGILNAGDKYYPDAIAEVCEAFDNQIDIIYGNCLWVDKTNNMEYIRRPEQSIELVKYRMPLIHPATFVKKAVYDRIGGFDITFKHSMDRELILRMYNAGCNFQYVDKELVIFEAGGVSDKNLDLCMEESKRISTMSGIPVLEIRMRSLIGRLKIRFVRWLKKYPKLYLKFRKL